MRVKFRFVAVFLVWTAKKLFQLSEWSLSACKEVLTWAEAYVHDF